MIRRLSLHGDIAIGSNISLFYRGHPGSHTASLHKHTFQEFCASDLAISKEIARQADLLGINTYQEWQHEYKSVIHYGLAPERIDLWNPMIRDWLLNDQNSDEIIPGYSTKRLPAKLLKKCIYLFMPPIFLGLFQKAKMLTLLAKLKSLLKEQLKPRAFTKP